MILIDLEKAYDKQFKKVLGWPMLKKDIPKKYIHIVQDIYWK